ncbi:MAG: NUDIX hydrolase, partial [Sphaerochaetaceae bacterium]|nr:NUDIX hydrolase [Sphaerochaetaceae bacterium]
MLLETIAEKYIWFLLVILAGNLMQRKHQARSQKKRLATLIIAALAMLLQIFITLILTWKWPQWVVFPALVIVVALAFLLRNRLFIFKTTCASCSKKLSFTQAFNFDDNLCDECHAEAHPEEVKIKEVPKAEEKIVALCKAETVDEIDWDFWEPTETAVLCYLFED